MFENELTFGNYNINFEISFLLKRKTDPLNLTEICQETDNLTTLNVENDEVNSELDSHLTDQDFHKFDLEIKESFEMEPQSEKYEIPNESSEYLESQLPETSINEKTADNDNLDTAYDSMSKLESTHCSDISHPSLSQLVELNEKNMSSQEGLSNVFDSILSEKVESSSLSELPSYSQLINLEPEVEPTADMNKDKILLAKTPLTRHLFNEGNNTSFEISNLEDLEDNSLSDEDLSESIFDPDFDTTFVKSDEKPSNVDSILGDQAIEKKLKKHKKRKLKLENQNKASTFKTKPTKKTKNVSPNQRSMITHLKTSRIIDTHNVENVSKHD